MNFLDRLREPSTYAGIAAFFTAILTNLEALAPGAEQVSWVVLTIAILTAVGAIITPSQGSKLKQEVESLQTQLKSVQHQLRQ